MSVAKDFETIESLPFIVQFSVLSGFNSLLQAFAYDATLKALRLTLGDQPDARQAVSDRINQVLTRQDVELYDESIAAYLFCVWKTDPPTAHKASERVLATGGLWWSVRLSLHIIKEAQVRNCLTRHTLTSEPTLVLDPLPTSILKV